MSFTNSSRDDPLLLLTLNHLLQECSHFGISTTNKDRDQLLRELNQATGRCYSVSASAPVSTRANAYVQNNNA